MYRNLQIFLKSTATCFFVILINSASANDKANLKPSLGQIKGYVADTLKDPASAQFRNLKRGKEVLCGEVNGKNSYGGYVGFKRFITKIVKNDFGTEVFIEGAGHVGTSTTPMLSVLIEAEVSHAQAKERLKRLQEGNSEKNENITDKELMEQRNKMVFDVLWSKHCM